MSELSSRRSLAIRVHLQHTLSSAMVLAKKFKREYTTYDKRISAVDHWVQIIKQALSVCGVYGLCAVDRAEEQVRLFVRQDACLDKYFRRQCLEKARLLGHSAKCYVQALQHQKSGSANLLTMWLHASDCTDKVISLQAEAAQLNSFRDDFYSYLDSLSTLESSVQEKLSLALEKMQSAVSGGEIPAARLHRLAYEQFSRAAAYVILDDLFATYPMVFPRIKESGRVIVRCGRAANEAGECLTAAARVASAALESEQGQHLVPLRRLVIEGYKHAAELLSPWEHPPDQEIQRAVGRSVASSARTVHSLLTTLAPAVAQFHEQSRGAQVSSRAAWLNETEELLVDACRQIAESSFGRCLSEPAKMELQYHETTRLTALVAAVVDRIKGGASKYDKDERAIAEYAAKGKAVDRTQSPAHALMAECWLQAAMQLSNAIASVSAVTAAEPPERSAETYYAELPATRETLLRRCAKVYADLATVTFADTAVYYQRSNRTPAGQGRELWREASELLMQVGKERIGVVESALARQSNYSDPRECSSRVEVVESCARHCANAAELLEGLARADNPEAAQRVECRLAMAVVRLERAAIGSDPQLSIGRCAQTFASLLVDVITLVRSQASRPPPLPPHMAHLQPGSTPEDRALRQRRVEWLYGACLVASDLICTHSERLSGDGARAIENAQVSCRAVFMAITGHNPDTSDYDDEPEEADEEGGTESHQRACDRYLQAATAVVAGRSLECTAWMKAGDAEGRARTLSAHQSPEAAQYPQVLGDTLARAAWRLRGAEGPVPAHLLAFADGPPEDFQHTRLVDLAVEAEMEQGRQVAAQSRLQKKPAAVYALHKRAAEQFKLASDFAQEHVAFAVVLGLTRHRAPVAERAMLSGRRFAQAAEALREGKAGVSSLYMRAAELVSTSPTSYSKPHPETAQAVADKAGERYEQAARALAAGDRALHQLWTRAAQATEALLVVTIVKNTKRCTLALADGYSEQKVAEADALAAQATGARDSASGSASAAGASSARKRKVPQEGQEKEEETGKGKEKREEAPSKQREQATKRKRKG